MKTYRKINKWMANQETSNIGMLLFAIVFIAMLCNILATTTIGFNNPKESIIGSTLVTNGSIHLDITQMQWTDNAVYGLEISGMVFAGCAWLAIATGWYLDPTKLDERLSTTLALGLLILSLIVSVAGVGHYEAMHSNTNKGYIAGDMIMIIIPTVLAIGLMIDPTIQAFKNKSIQAK